MEVIIAPKARGDIASILALYRVTESRMVEIGRVLHDSMDLKAHLPEEYQRSAE